MFTGIIEDVGRIRRIQRKGVDSLFVVETNRMDLSGFNIGDSMAVNGVCLTLIDKSGNSFSADVSAETLSVTTLAECKVGSRVNLEPALTLNKPLGGHLVSGHVDGVGKVVSRKSDGRSERFRVQIPGELARYVAAKGSITIDGISLTVNSVADAFFEVNLIPHTLEQTSMGNYRPGQKVNLEVDLLARYLERLMPGGRSPSETTLETLLGKKA